jgi:hypothetical protein
VVITEPGGGGSIALDATHDELYVLVSWLGESIIKRVDVFAHASILTAGAVPERSIPLPDFFEAKAIALDVAHDRLWVGGLKDQYSQGELDIFEHASTRNGATTPERHIEGLAGIDNMALDTAHNVLYTLQGSYSTVSVYANAATLSTGDMPTGNIGGAGAFGIAVDGARDTLYLPNVFSGVGIVRNASTASPSAMVTLRIPGASPLSAAVDSARDRLYVGAYTQAFVVDNASTLTASSHVTAAAVSAPAGTSIFSFAFP